MRKAKRFFVWLILLAFSTALWPGALTQAAETSETEEEPLFTLAAISDLHTDAGIEGWEMPIRTGVIDTVNAIAEDEDANVLLLAGDLTSAHMGSYWGLTAEEKQETYIRAQNQIIATSRLATDSHRALFATGNHDFAVGTLDFNSGDYIDATEEYLSPMVAAESVYDTDANAYFQTEMPEGAAEDIRHVLAYHYNIDGMDFIVINTPYTGADKHSDYYYDMDSLDWVYNKLEAIGEDKTVFIVAHYPLSSDKNVTSGKGVNNTTQVKLKGVLDAFPNAIYLYGHDHGGMKIAYDTYERITTYDLSGNAYDDRDVAPTGFTSSFVGSMAYYGSDVLPVDLGSETPNVVQGLMVYVYSDRIVFQMKNYGEDDMGSYILQEYVIERDVELEKYADVSDVRARADEVEVSVGDTEEIGADVLPNNAGYKRVKWSSGDESVATVDSTGTVTGISEGETVITVTTVEGGYTDTCRVTVTKASEEETPSEPEILWSLTKTQSDVDDLVGGEYVISVASVSTVNRVSLGLASSELSSAEAYLAQEAVCDGGGILGYGAYASLDEDTVDQNLWTIESSGTDGLYYIRALNVENDENAYLNVNSGSVTLGAKQELSITVSDGVYTIMNGSIYLRFTNSYSYNGLTYDGFTGGSSSSSSSLYLSAVTLTENVEEPDTTPVFEDNGSDIPGMADCVYELESQLPESLSLIYYENGKGDGEEGVELTVEVDQWSLSEDESYLPGSLIHPVASFSCNGEECTYETEGILIYSSKLLYFVDCGSSGSEAFEMMADAVELANSGNSDQQFDGRTKTAFGYLYGAGAVQTSRLENELLNTGRYAGSKDSTITYRFWVEPGTYVITTGHAQWWDDGDIHDVTVTASYNGQTFELGTSEGINSIGKQNEVSGTVEVEDVGSGCYLTLKFENAGEKEAVVSYIAIEKTADGEDTSAGEDEGSKLEMLEEAEVQTDSSGTDGSSTAGSSSGTDDTSAAGSSSGTDGASGTGTSSGTGNSSDTESASSDTSSSQPENGSVYEVGELRYKVTSSTTVTVTKLLDQSETSVEIPAEVTLDGYTFKVTAIGKKAFASAKKLKSAVIGKNVTQIGARAFYGCKKLAKVTFKGTKAPSIGKKAFKGIKAKCKVYAPKKMARKQYSLLKSRMKKAGAGSQVSYSKKG